MRFGLRMFWLQKLNKYETPEFWGFFVSEIT